MATPGTVVLLEAAGFDVILIETVGVGQSEVAVANMVIVRVVGLARTGDCCRASRRAHGSSPTSWW